MGDLDGQLKQAKIILSQLSNYAKSLDESRVMYAVNRAWLELDVAHRDLLTRSVKITNGDGTSEAR